MAEKVKRKSAAPAAKRASTPRKPVAAKVTSAKPRNVAARTQASATKPVKTKTANAGAKSAKTKAPSEVERLAKRVAQSAIKAKESKPKTKAAAARTPGTKAAAEERGTGYRIGEPLLDPIGDTTDGEGRTYAAEAEDLADRELEAFRADTNFAATDSGLEAGRGLESAQLAIEERARQAALDAAASATAATADESESEPEAREAGKLERLQKILSQAGIASRRRAEEMIVAGRVMVNGQVVTQLGSKADVQRDHIRVDGKLLHGAERHRYFLLNKPKGYVTTVSDPEGRPTVMQFFAKMSERLYPVGRLDFQSEGLLLMTNDGELANLLTKAGSGVEKIYLVKVAGQPSEEQLERLRGGVAIEKGEAGSERVHAAPARIRQVRHGDNPWFEVVLTEGRNRELRKMFAAIGHFAEKIRRVGYGPLALDVEPGKMRELRPEEVQALRLTAEGEMKPRRINVDRMLPREAGIAAEKRDRAARRGNRGAGWRSRTTGQPTDRSQGRFDRAPEQRRRDQGRDQERFGRPDRSWQQSARSERPQQREGREHKKEWQPRDREFRPRGEKRPFGGGERRERGGARFEGGGRSFGGNSRVNPGLERGTRDTGEPPRFGGRREGQRPFGGKPRFERPRFERGPQSEGGGGRFDGERRKPFAPRGERPDFKRSERPEWKGSASSKPRFDGGRGKGFQKGAKPGGKPGGFGKFRGTGGGGRKFGGGRPGAQRGGWKRG
jgi:23S rRNA pseudouridine2605 synthase